MEKAYGESFWEENNYKEDANDRKSFSRIYM